MGLDIESLITAKMPPPPQGERSSDIQELRQQIDAIDEEIIELISKRIELSSRVMQMKTSSQVIDTNREQVIIKRYYEKLSDVSTMAKVKRLVAGIIGTSKVYPD